MTSTNQSAPLLIVIAGPTAVGKTAAAIEVAEALGADILSADSRQFFKETSIVTAHPSAEELQRVKHHFVDFLDIHTSYSAGDFERDALEFLEVYFKTKRVLVVTGGSGMYINALLQGFDELPSDPMVREALNKEFEIHGIQKLQEELKLRDPEHYDRMDIHNHMRLIRALEVCRITQAPYSQLRTGEAKPRPFRWVMAGITCEREELYARINKRVDEMVVAGMVEEARRLYPHRGLNALNTVGYNELFDYFDGKLTLEESIALIKQHTRNFAKRQMTWFNRQANLVWFDRTELNQLVAWAQNEAQKTHD
ncbi:MAG: hypothetical protein RL226_1088, partial [Bacteroidota bacterium]